ncbi:hypothetical protein VTK56DRAFT_7508 [Thermocarpiscus australiensis]
MDGSRQWPNLDMAHHPPYCWPETFNHQYVALKIYIHNSVRHRELPFYEHLNKVLPSRHPGAGNVRKLVASFEVKGPHGSHIALVLQVSQMSLRDMDTVFMHGRGFR